MDFIEQLNTSKRILEDVYIIDAVTGEILGNYEKVPYEKPSDESVAVEPEQATSEEQLREICKGMGEKANYSPILIIDHLKESDKVNYIRLLKLSNRLSYRNILILPKSELCELLETSQRNLTRSLERMESKGYLKVSSDKTFYKNHIKIFLNPAMVWRGHGLIRLVKINSWYNLGIPKDYLKGSPEYKETIVETDETFDYSRKDDQDYIESFSDPYVSKRSFKNSSRVNKILGMTEEEFSLFLLGISQ